jgi:hypothetical protein
MKRFTLPLLTVLIGLSLAGCPSSDTPQASPELTKDFKGGPMPPDFAKNFQQGMKKPGQGQQAPDGGKK